MAEHILSESLHRYARPRLASPPHLIATPREYPSRVTIKNVSDEVLRKIFSYFLDISPRDWPTLVHTCRHWRQFVFASQRALHLRLFCTHGTPVRKRLSCWPTTLPIVVEYGGSLALDPPAPEDENNVIVALNQSHRVTSINLTVTNPLMQKLSDIEGPFLELEDLILLSQDTSRLTLPSAFGCGTRRLRTLHLTRIAFFALPHLLYSSRNIIDLQLHDVLNPWLLLPEALTDALSGMAQLRSLSLHLLPIIDHIGIPPPSRTRFLLPALTHLNFQGITEYLERLVGGVDAPHLGAIEITFVFNGSQDESAYISNLRKSIDRIAMHRSHRRVHIQVSEHGISVNWMKPGAPAYIKLQVSCERLSKQLSSMSRILTHFHSFYPGVEDLHISATRQSIWEDSTLWPELLTSFTGVKWLHVTADPSTDIVLVLQQHGKPVKSVLPSLQKLYVVQPETRRVPLSETVESLMISRSLSGHPIAVEYERLCQIDELYGAGRFSQRTTTEMLSDDIMLNIFRQCLSITPRIWPTLVRVCHKWRQIVLASPLSLNLRLHCTHGTPVLEALNCCLALPIVVQYGGSPNLNPPAPEDDDNIIAALKKSDRVSSISLTVTSSLTEKLSAISDPLSELEELALLSEDNIQLILPTTFRWGHRLRTLHSTRIGFPSFPQLLLPSQDLVDLQLHEIPSTGYFPPEEFANALSGMSQLRSLSLHLLSFPRRRSYLELPAPQGEHIVLPVLTRLKYRGISKYLDSLVARIDAPRLGDIDITFFSQPTMDALQLGLFIERIGMQTSLSQADIVTYAHAISISLSDSSTPTPLRIEVPCKPIDWQLSCMAQVCDQLSLLLSRVNNLLIDTPEPSSTQADVSGDQWAGLLRAFGSATSFSLTGMHVTDILSILRPADGEHTTDIIVLPNLRHLHLDKLTAMDGPLRHALQSSFMVSRSLSGRPLQVDPRSYPGPCHICCFCRSGFGRQQELKRHLRDSHAYRIVCSYCNNFKFTPENDQLFIKHLESKHPEAVINDSVLSDAYSMNLPLSQLNAKLDSIADWHSCLLAPVQTTSYPFQVTPPPGYAYQWV